MGCAGWDRAERGGILMSLLADAGTSATAATGDAGTQAAAATATTTAQTTTQQSGDSSTAATTQTAQTTPSSWYSQLVKDPATGEINPAAWDALPPELQAYKPTFAQSKNMNGLMMQMANLASLAGKKGLAPLPEGASEQAKTERAALLRQINRTPEKIEDYGVKKPDDIPDELWNPELANTVLGEMHKLGASPEMVKAVFEADRASTIKAIEAHKAAKAEFVAAEGKVLKETFGADFDRKIDLAKRGARTLGLDPNDPLFGNSKLVIAMAKYAESISEDKLVSGDSQQTNGGSDKARAMDIINNAGNSLHKAYHDPSDPMHEQAKSQVNTLMAAGVRKR